MMMNLIAANIPAYTEDATYHGHGNRVFVANGLTVPASWTVVNSIAPSG